MEKNSKSGGLIWVHLGAILAVTAWGVSFINTRVLMDTGFTPVEVFLYRCIIAYLLLLCFSFRDLKFKNLRHELLFLLCGICGGSVYFVAENTALVYTSTTNVSLITSTSPLINALLVGLLYRDERPSRGLVIGSCIAMAGVAMVILGGGESSGGHAAESEAQIIGGGVLGDALSLMAALCWSIYALVLRKLNPYYSAITITRKTFFYGLLTAIPFIFLEPSVISPETFLETKVWVNLLILSLFSSSLAYVIWAWVIGKIGAVKAGNYLYFQPMVTLIFSAIILNEMVGIWGIIGCIVTIIGVYAGEKLSLRQRLIP
ncbi:MAG: DMT family transporter [Muribaculaceae bacterium]|nr:DMT family transporter [Bacteroides sp.]MDE6033411.1 DMT family transporter [Muribaculaceae bacterium]MDE6427555.1 DMT family transporter [Muribaculaceae bacterium]